MRVLVTGGAGYIGSHTIIELYKQGLEEIISIDNFINSDASNYDRIEKISGRKVNSYVIDLLDQPALDHFFKTENISAVIHFAALKSVPDSVEFPNLYYQNNIGGLLNVLECMKKYSVNHFIFSSSCSVYGNPEELPVTEKSPFGEAESPYARSKQMGEDIIKDFSKVNPNFKAISLRYFNPVGAHPSGLIGEGFTKRPNNLVPIITQTAIGLREQLTVFGNNYSTRDGSCIRDYIHVCDIANAHVLALNHLSKSQENYKVINLGSGKGTTVLEMINTFEKVNKKQVNYQVGQRRAGDVESIYANNNFAKQVLNWEAKFSLEEMVETAWNWQKTQVNDGTSPLSKS